MPPSSYQVPQFNQPRYQPQDRQELAEGWKEGEKGEVSTRIGIKRKVMEWDFGVNLYEVGEIGERARTGVDFEQINMQSNMIQEWSAHYNAIASEQQRSTNAVPDRMPTIESVNDMIASQAKIGDCLKRMQHMILQQQKDIEESQNLRYEGARGPGSYDEEMSMYGDDMKNHGFGVEGKKRRGVCPKFFLLNHLILTINRELHLQEDATAATEQKRLNGDEDQTAPEHSATRAAYTTPN